MHAKHHFEKQTQWLSGMAHDQEVMGSIPILMFIQHLSLTPMKLRMPLDNPEKTFAENVSPLGTQIRWRPAGVLSPPCRRALLLSSFQRETSTVG